MSKNCRQLTDEEKDIIRFCTNIYSESFIQVQSRETNSIVVTLESIVYVLAVLNAYFIITLYIEKEISNTLLAKILGVAVIVIILAYVFRIIYSNYLSPEGKEIARLKELKKHYEHKCKDFMNRIKNDEHICPNVLQPLKFYDELLGLTEFKKKNKLKT